LSAKGDGHILPPRQIINVPVPFSPSIPTQMCPSPFLPQAVAGRWRTPSVDSGSSHWGMALFSSLNVPVFASHVSDRTHPSKIRGSRFEWLTINVTCWSGNAPPSAIESIRIVSPGYSTTLAVTGGRTTPSSRIPVTTQNRRCRSCQTLRTRKRKLMSYLPPWFRSWSRRFATTSISFCGSFHAL